MNPACESDAGPGRELAAGAEALRCGRLDEALHIAKAVGEAASAELAGLAIATDEAARPLLTWRARARALAGRVHLERFDFPASHRALLAARADWHLRPGLDPLAAGSTEAALASLHWLCDEPDAALHAARAAIASMPVHPEGSSRLDAAHIVSHLAFIDVPGRSAADVQEQLRAALVWIRAEPRLSPLEEAGVLFLLAMTEQRLGHHREASDIFKHVQEIRVRVLGARHLYVGYVLHGLAQTALDLGDLKRAIGLADASLEILLETVGPTHPNVTTVLLTRGMAVLLGESADRFTTAEADFRRALEVSQGHFGRESPQNAMSWLMLGVGYYAAADAEPSEDALRRALAAAFKHPRTRGEVAVMALRHLFELWRLQGRYDEVASTAEQAVEIFTAHPALPVEPAVRWALDGSDAALEMDDPDTARALLEKAWPLARDSAAVGETLRIAIERSLAAVRGEDSADLD